MNTQDFNELVGKKFTLIKSNLLNHFQLDKVVYEVLEDESDGYRSMMKHVAIVDDDAPDSKWVGKEILGEVEVIVAPKNWTQYDWPKGSYDIFEGYQLKSTSDGHIWLTFGTDNADDYYPSFTFHWTPKQK